MRTVQIDDELFERAEAKAASEGRTLTSLVEEALQECVERGEQHRERIVLPVHRGGRMIADLDLSNNAAVRDFLDEADRDDHALS
jgi:hypothetical protein